MKFNTKFDRPKSSGFACGKGRTHQSFKNECDINVIMKRAMATGVMPVASRVAQYGDFSSVKDYQQSLDLVISAQDMFAAMPSHIRARFNNDPASLLQFVNDKANFDEAVKLGLIEPKVASPVLPKVDSKEVSASKEVPPKSSGEPPSK